MKVTREMLIEEFIGKDNMDEKMEMVMYPIEFVTEITDNMEFVSTSDSLGFPFSIYKEKNGDYLFGYIDYPEDWFSDEDEEGKMELNYVMKEELTYGCWSSVVDWFWNQFCCHTTDRIQLLKAIDDALFKNKNRITDEETNLFFCFDTNLDDVDSIDELHIIENAPDKYYPKAFRATLDKYGNPALYKIEIPTMLERILKTVEAKLEVDGEIIEMEEQNGEEPYISTRDLREQIKWLKNEIAKEAK